MYIYQCLYVDVRSDNSYMYGVMNKFKKNMNWIAHMRRWWEGLFLPSQGFSEYHHNASILRRQTPCERPPADGEQEKVCNTKTLNNEKSWWEILPTNLRVDLIQLHHHFSQELIAWPVLCVEIHRRSTESSNQRVYLFYGDIPSSIIWCALVCTCMEVRIYKRGRSLTLFGLRKSKAGWFKRLRTFSTFWGMSAMAWRANHLLTTWKKMKPI